ncbi:RNA polymerase II-associated factor 1-like protein, partial [Stegodyphus mimosarum]
MGRESQIAAINKTFSDAKIPIEKHYSKPNVYAVEELPVFPDYQLWRYPFAQVMFDTEPASNSQMEEMSQAMIRGVMDESGEQFVAYFLPTEETMKKRKRDAENGVEYEDEEEYEYKMAREYNWNVKNKASKGYEENYFFVFRDGCVYYNELETRVRLSKRRLKPGAQPNSNSKLVVRHRPLNEMEFKTQELRMMQLDAPQEEEEEEEEEVAQANGEKENEAEEENEGGEEQDQEEEKESASSESEAENKKDDDEKEEESEAEAASEEEEEKEQENDRASNKSASSSKSSSSSSSESEAEEADDQKKR